MSFRAKVILVTSIVVAASVWVVAAIVSYAITQTFEEGDARRTQALIAQFEREVQRRGDDVARRIDAIANSQDAARIASALGEPQAEPGQFVNEATPSAQEQSLDFLEFAGADGAIISSVQWPMRFAYKEEWLTQPVDWKAQPAFLKREELADGSALGLFVVRAVRSGNGAMFVAGGLRVDQKFVESLALPEGMRATLWDATSKPDPSLDALIGEVRRQPQPRSQLSSSGEDTLTAIPLLGRDRQLLGAFVVANSRRDLLALKASIIRTAALVGGGGILLGIALSWWAASRVTRPLRQLTASVRRVAGGDWDARAGIRSRDEIGRLATDFNHMTAQLVEQKQHIIQTERVAAWRELARRLAHELKNPLFPLQITVENLQRARDSSPEQFEEVFRESTTTLLAELQNLKTIIGRFSDFAKMPAPQLESVDLNDLARETMRFFEPQFHAPGRPEIGARVELAADLPRISADPEQLRRAVRNLVLNAMDAMPAGGAVTIRTAKLGESVAIEVSDTGEGLTKEECERLFTPYYTTKRHGTGLGLAIVQSVVSDHHASISVESEPGKGATFRVQFRVAE